MKTARDLFAEWCNENRPEHRTVAWSAFKAGVEAGVAAEDERQKMEDSRDEKVMGRRLQEGRF